MSGKRAYFCDGRKGSQGGAEIKPSLSRQYPTPATDDNSYVGLRCNGQDVHIYDAIVQRDDEFSKSLIGTIDLHASLWTTTVHVVFS